MLHKCRWPGWSTVRGALCPVIRSGFNSPLAHRFREAFVIALNLIGVSHREGRDGLIKRVGLAKVAADQGRFAGTGVGARQRAPAPLGENDHLGGPELLRWGT